MKYPQKTNNVIQTKVIRPKQELQAASTVKNLPVVNEDAPFEITAVKKSNTSSAAIYWVVFFTVSAISAILYTVLSNKAQEPQVVKREVHKIYEKVEIRSRQPAAVLNTNSSDINYFEKGEIRNKINQRYDVLRQNLWTEHSNRRDIERKKDNDYYYSHVYHELNAYYDRKHLMLRGEKAVELCEKINEDCDRAAEFLAFKKNNPHL
jgi:hypothetical protein